MTKRNHAIGVCFWGFRWLYKMYDDFYWKAEDVVGHRCHCSLRLNHLKEQLQKLVDGDLSWVDQIVKDSTFAKELPGEKAREGVVECAKIWLDHLNGKPLCEKPKCKETAVEKKTRSFEERECACSSG
mmetsp:Transcript_24074/g.37783  ORF Transcript_24074/g.37783 Transcript_24074/m.37783 type:complete len:128 (-) Transcript_24074:376-759(-)